MSRLLVVTVGYQAFVAPAEILPFLQHVQPLSRHWNGNVEQFYHNSDSVTIQFVDQRNVLIEKPENDK